MTSRTKSIGGPSTVPSITPSSQQRPTTFVRRPGLLTTRSDIDGEDAVSFEVLVGAPETTRPASSSRRCRRPVARRRAGGAISTESLNYRAGDDRTSPRASGSDRQWVLLQHHVRVHRRVPGQLRAWRIPSRTPDRPEQCSSRPLGRDGRGPWRAARGGARSAHELRHDVGRGLSTACTRLGCTELCSHGERSLRRRCATSIRPRRLCDTEQERTWSLAVTVARQPIRPAATRRSDRRPSPRGNAGDPSMRRGGPSSTTRSVCRPPLLVLCTRRAKPTFDNPL